MAPSKAPKMAMSDAQPTQDVGTMIRSNGKFRRDYIYVHEAVEAYLLLTEKMVSHKLLGQAFNFNGETLSTLEITRKILQLMDRSDLKPVILNKAPDEILEQSLSANKAHRLLGWKTHYTIQKGLEETIAWYKKYLSQKVHA